MIPIADNIKQRCQPIVTSLLIGFTVALFLSQLKLEAVGKLGDFLQTWGVVPAKLSDMASAAIKERNPAAFFALIAMGVPSLISGIFLHSSFSQLLGNLLFLWVFGQRVEQVLGHWRFLFFYLICGIFATAVQISTAPNLKEPLIGANGAVAGILGAYVFRFPNAKVETILPLVVVFIPIELPAFFYLLWWFIQQGFYGIGQLAISGGVVRGGIAYWAHVVGLALGAWLMYWKGKSDC